LVAVMTWSLVPKQAGSAKAESAAESTESRRWVFMGKSLVFAGGKSRAADSKAEARSSASFEGQAAVGLR
jgi:hypothetical protein